MENMLKPKYVLYTGTEQPEEKEILRNIFNSNWEEVDPSLITDMKNKFREAEEAKIDAENIGMDEADIKKLKTEIKEVDNNYYGEIIKIIMITASGAEGISLSNVRYVHITEPYWHPVRINQIIGRARRICSHKALPEDLRTVEVFLYLMTFSEEQLKSDLAREAKVHDRSKIDPTQVLTSDQALYEIAKQKEVINRNILQNIKEAAIDCTIHKKTDSKEQLQCFTFGSINPDKFAYTPLLDPSNTDEDEVINKMKITRKLKTVVLPPKTGQKYEVDMQKVVKGNEDKDGFIKAPLFPANTHKTGDFIEVGTLYFDKKLAPVKWEILGT